jgi:hypothetical protein
VSTRDWRQWPWRRVPPPLRRAGCARQLARHRPLLAPALLNALGTTLQLGSLLFLPAAVLAGLRGFFILWTAQLSAAYSLKDAPASPGEWRCIYACLAGALCVGAGALAGSAAGGGGGDGEGAAAGTLAALSGSGGSVALGLALSVAGYALASGQVALEQLLLDSTYSRWEILGVEGALSAAFTLGALGVLQAVFQATQPASASGVGVWGSLDVPEHTLECGRGSPGVALWAAVYGLVGLTFNALLLTVAQAIGPNMRVLVFTARGVLTWGIEVSLYYGGGALGVRGTALSGWSALEAVGFGALIWGGAVRASLVAEREALAAALAGAGAAAAEEGKGEGSQVLAQPLLSK